MLLLEASIATMPSSDCVNSFACIEAVGVALPVLQSSFDYRVCERSVNQVARVCRVPVLGECVEEAPNAGRPVGFESHASRAFCREKSRGRLYGFANSTVSTPVLFATDLCALPIDRNFGTRPGEREAQAGCKGCTTRPAD